MIRCIKFRPHQKNTLREFGADARQARKQFRQQAIEAIHAFADEQDSEAGS